MAFFKSGMLGYGGGLSAIPLMQHEVVKIYEWMDDEEFADILALANTLPGPINTKLAGYIGWRVGGWVGMLNAIIAASVPKAILMVLLLTILYAYKYNPFVQGMLKGFIPVAGIIISSQASVPIITPAKGVIPVAGVMIGTLAWGLIRLSDKLMGWMPTIILSVVSLIVMEVFNVHPAFLILGIFIVVFIQRD